MLVYCRTEEGGQGHKGSQVPQTSIKMTDTPAFKLSDPPENLVSLLFADTRIHAHTLKISLNRNPAAKETSSQQLEHSAAMKSFKKLAPGSERRETQS